MGIELTSRAVTHAERVAIIDDRGCHTYGELLEASEKVAAGLLAGRADLEEARVVFLIPPGFQYVSTQWGIWLAGGIAVPLATMYPTPELEYVIDDVGASAIIVDSGHAEKVRGLADARSMPVLSPDALSSSARSARLPEVNLSRLAMILYTSGTTSRPKGVVSTHANVQAQISALVEAWEWEPADRILNVLPLHHVHGIINVLSCALQCGACCEFLTPFDAQQTWQRLASGELTLFMAVPTIYAKLIQAWHEMEPAQQRRYRENVAQLRLMVSGSAALPVPTLEKWRDITGQTLLERYGMTEIGMALSNPLHGERRPGHVGTPLPNIEIRRVDEAGAVVTDETPGEIEVRGPTVFRGYWERPDATQAAFRADWFRTGDVAVIEDGAFRILGRTSVDIIKTGGFKVSALEIEAILCDHPRIRECAVVGIEDEEWGERVAACIVTDGDDPLSLDALRGWTAERLAPYKTPRQLRVTSELPRNAMGKVQKRAVAALFRSP